jgi:hypothetical protein
MQHGPDENAKNVVKNTRGVMFFGTPFLGSSKSRWAALAQKFSKVFGGFAEANTNDIQALTERSQTLITINHNFAKFLMERASSAQPIRLVCFFEELSVKVKGKRLPGVGQIVSKESAVIVGVDPIGIEEDHLNMCKFEDDERSRYRRASEALSSWINDLYETPKEDPSKVSPFHDLKSPLNLR